MKRDDHGHPPEDSRSPDDGHLRYLLTAYIFGDISSAGRAEVEQHLDICDACREEYELLRETVDLVSDLVGDAEAEDPEYSFEERRVDRVLATSRPRSLRARRWVLPVSSAAAALLLIGLFTPFFLSMRSSPDLAKSTATFRNAGSDNAGVVNDALPSFAHGHKAKLDGRMKEGRAWQADTRSSATASERPVDGPMARFGQVERDRAAEDGAWFAPDTTIEQSGRSSKGQNGAERRSRLASTLRLIRATPPRTAAAPAPVADPDLSPAEAAMESEEDSPETKMFYGKNIEEKFHYFDDKNIGVITDQLSIDATTGEPSLGSVFSVQPNAPAGGAGGVAGGVPGGGQDWGAITVPKLKLELGRGVGGEASGKRLDDQRAEATDREANQLDQLQAMRQQLERTVTAAAERPDRGVEMKQSEEESNRYDPAKKRNMKRRPKIVQLRERAAGAEDSDEIDELLEGVAVEPTDSFGSFSLAERTRLGEPEEFKKRPDTGRAEARGGQSQLQDMAGGKDLANSQPVPETANKGFAFGLAEPAQKPRATPGRNLEESRAGGGEPALRESFGERQGVGGYGWLGQEAVFDAEKGKARSLGFQALDSTTAFDWSGAVRPSDDGLLSAGEKTEELAARLGDVRKETIKAGFDTIAPATDLPPIDGKLSDLYRRNAPIAGVEFQFDTSGQTIAGGTLLDPHPFQVPDGLSQDEIQVLADNTVIEEQLRANRYFRYKVPAREEQSESRTRPTDGRYEQSVAQLLVPEPAIGDEGLGREGFRARYGVNPFVDTRIDHLSTFAMDVDTAAYTRARDLLQAGQRPDPSAVRVEAFVNSFGEELPADPGHDFSVFCEGAPSPFGTGVDLVKVSVKARELDEGERLPTLLTLAVDTSGSMFLEGRLNTVRQSLSLLVDALDPADRIAVVAYGSEAYLALPHTPARERERILSVLGSLDPHGDTNVEAGLDLAYRVADDAFATRAMNRVILLSDGVATSGAREADELLDRVRLFADRGLYLSVIGFGRERYNDAFLGSLAQQGNGNYAYVDDVQTAYDLFVRDLPSTLQVLARDAKIQVDFDPTVVSHYRLLGYVNRDIRDQDFRNDAVDAGEVGPGSTVTALYEVRRHPGSHGALGRVAIRYYATTMGRVEELGFPLQVGVIATSLAEASDAFVFSACLAELAELLMDSYWAQTGSFGRVSQALSSIGPEFRADPRFAELANMVEAARRLTIEQLSDE